MRDAGNGVDGVYDLEAMKKTLKEANAPFQVFGGEPLLVPFDDLEELFRFGLEMYEERRARGVKQNSGPNGIQTNGTLITEEHIELFKKYRVSVGMSVDGPDELNDTRWAGGLESTQKATAQSLAALDRLLQEGMSPSIILTLNRNNAGTREKVDRLKAWLRDLDAKGLQSARLHNLEIDHTDVENTLGLTSEQTIAVFIEMIQLETQLKNLKFDVFADIEKTLQAKEEDVTCTWTACDPYTTPAVHGVDGQGNLSNCGRTNKDGITWLKAEEHSRERQLALYNTPQEHGGCQGCRFFMQCKGQCPGTAIDGDWRNKSVDCGLWMALLTIKEAQLLAKGILPMSQAPDRLDREKKYLNSLMSSAGAYNVNSEHGDKPHGDHTDLALIGKGPEDHGDAPHGDMDHGDAPHGDHDDLAAVPVGDRKNFTQLPILKKVS